MKGRLYLIHWNPLEAQEYAYLLRGDGWEVDVESKNGARAGSKILTNLPDAVVIYLSRLPSHGCITAHSLRSFSVGHDLPIVFVDGKREAKKMAKEQVPDGIFTTSGELSRLLGRLKKAVASN